MTRFEGASLPSRTARGGRNARDIYVAAAAGEVCSMYCACNMARVVTALERAGIQLQSPILIFAVVGVIGTAEEIRGRIRR